MKQIVKIPIRPQGVFHKMPDDAQVLSVTCDGQDTIVWALTEKDRSDALVEFITILTDHNWVDLTPYTYAGSTTLRNGNTIHVFYRPMTLGEIGRMVEERELGEVYYRPNCDFCGEEASHGVVIDGKPLCMCDKCLAMLKEAAKS